MDGKYKLILYLLKYFKFKIEEYDQFNYLLNLFIQFF